MLPHWFMKYVGEGLLFIVGYIIISNTLWLLIGAKALQMLPGVSDKSAKGTLKIMVLLIMSLIGILFWLIKLLPKSIGLIRNKKSFTEEISLSIQSGSRLYQKIIKKKKKVV